MNIKKLREAEAEFLRRFPEGFDDPGLDHIKKSHNVDKLADYTRAKLTELTFSKPQQFADTLLDIVSRSSMVSRFEKPPFKEFLGALSSADKRHLAEAFRKRLVGRKKREGFDEIVGLFARYKLARWSLVSAVPFYFAPTQEAFVKPTTAKKILTYLDIKDLHYFARPDWDFYDGYRKLVREIKKLVDPSLTPNCAATTGFLMVTM
jgi:hypothetical protein